MYRRKWKDTKCFLPPDHDPLFNADMIIRKPTTCNYYPQMDLEMSKPSHGPYMYSNVAPDTACSLQSEIRNFAAWSLYLWPLCH